MMRSFILALVLGSTACGGSTPPAKTPDEAPQPTAVVSRPPHTAGAPSVSQELGSIDEHAVQQTFDRLQTKLEVCHKQGRDRVEYLAGDVKVFLRVGADGRVKYAYFEDSTVGDRETEKCLLDLFTATDWPKPQGGEAEVRNGFGWSGGSERAPASWPAEKMTNALGPDGRHAIDQCKTGTHGEFRVTAYVEPSDVDEPTPEPAKPAKPGKGKPASKPAAAKEPGGKLKAIGIAVPNKEAAPKAECILDALRGVALPSPGSYAAKVTFTL